MALTKYSYYSQTLLDLQIFFFFFFGSALHPTTSAHDVDENKFSYFPQQLCVSIHLLELRDESKSSALSC